MSFGLAFWQDACAGKPRIPSEILDKMIAEPRFAEASKRAFGCTLSRQRRFPVLSRALKDSRRLIYVHFVMFLHARGGITLTRIQQLCSELGLASPGRATAILLGLRTLGYIHAAPEQPNKRERLYLPSPELEDAMRAAMIDDAECLALIEPDAARAAARLTEPAFFREYMLMFGEGMMQFLRNGGNPASAFFAERDAGLIILYDMILSASPGDEFPPKGPLQMAVTDLAKRYGVSRSHVFRLFRDAETKGIIARADANTGTLSEDMRAAVVELSASLLVGFAICCGHAMRVAAGAAES